VAANELVDRCRLFHGSAGYAILTSRSGCIVEVSERRLDSLTHLAYACVMNELQA
jgi:hypothetical protein